jgi:glycerophosphoryl diester phosphodiesterase
MVGAGMAVLLLVFGWLYVRWSLAIPSFALEGSSLTEAVRRSVRRVRGSFWRVGVAHLAHHVTMALLFAALVFVFRLGGRPILVALFERSKDAGSVGVAALLALFSGLGGALGVLGTARLVSLTVVHHAALGGALERAGSAPAQTRRLRVGGVLLACALIAAFAAGLWFSLPRVQEEIARAAHPTKVSAHRGGALDAPENTLASLRSAIEARADSVEIDVQQTRDGTLVVIHDPNLGRLAGVDENVGQLSREDLARLDVGSHFSHAFRDERIPTLEQMLDAADGRISLLIELKTNGHETDAFVPDFVALLERKAWVDRCVVFSLEARFLERIRRLGSRLRIGVIITAKVGTGSDLDVDFYAVQPLLASSDFIRRAHLQGRDVYVWTVNDREDMTRLADRAADVLITDRPRLAREVLDARSTADGLSAAVRRLFGVD